MVNEIMSKTENFCFKSFVLSNKDKRVSQFDYVRIVYKINSLHADFIVGFARIVWPEFIEIDSKVFVKDLFDKERYDELNKDPESSSKSSFWMNLLEITGLFDELSYDQSMEMARIIGDSWNAKLDSEFKLLSVRSKVIAEQDTGEVFLTIV